MKLGVIGCGKMGRALVGGIVEAGIGHRSDVIVYDAVPRAAREIADHLGVARARSNAAVVDASEVVLLCVKPQGFMEMLAEIGEVEDRLLVSIAAGVRIAAIEEACAGRHRVVRVMPNTPALVGRGASAYALGSTATEADAEITESLLGAVGHVSRVEESDLDAVTGVSGSGPAYLFLMIEALVDGGVEQGLSREVALDLAVNTVAGAAELILRTGESPERLRENVTSPNGTTAEALESLHDDDFESIVRRAVAAATERSRELGEN